MKKITKEQHDRAYTYFNTIVLNQNIRPPISVLDTNEKILKMTQYKEVGSLLCRLARIVRNYRQQEAEAYQNEARTWIESLDLGWNK